MNLIPRVKEYIDRYNLIGESGCVLTTISGGADSVCLLLTLHDLGYPCEAVHCNFHLRGAESDRDEEFVRNLCLRIGVKLHIVHFDTAAYAEESGISIEMAARELRYAEFERIRSERGLDSIAVAHHRDDSVETVLLNLSRGTGIRGLTGIKPRNNNIIRPLLCVSRADIEEHLKERGESYVTDSTNLETEYRRNKVRLEVLPALRSVNPQVDTAIDETAQRLQQTCTLYISLLKEKLEQAIRTTRGRTVIDTSALGNGEYACALLYEALRPYGFKGAIINEVAAAMDREPGRIFESGTHTLLVDRGCLIVRSDVNAAVCSLQSRLIQEHHPTPFEPLKDSTVACLDEDLAGTTLTLRRYQAGDRFKPLGMKGFKLVSDFLTDRKTDLFSKQEQLVVTNPAGDIVWVAGLRIDDRFKVTERTRNVLLLRLEPTSADDTGGMDISATTKKQNKIL